MILQDPEGQASTPERITAAIESVNLLYRGLCKFHNERENSLALVKCDSGSDKSFDFTGLPQIIEQVKTMIFGIVDRVIYYRERKFSERVKCVAESLPILTQIAEMVESKKLAPEQAELLKRDLIAGATKFLESGSRIPELNEGTHYDPNSLLAPAPTLLLEGPVTSSEATSDTDSKTSSSLASKATAEGTKQFDRDQIDRGLTTDEVRRLRDLINLSERREDANEPD